jgi:nucleoside phosphorylase
MLSEQDISARLSEIGITDKHRAICQELWAYWNEKNALYLVPSFNQKCYKQKQNKELSFLKENNFILGSSIQGNPAYILSSLGMLLLKNVDEHLNKINSCVEDLREIYDRAVSAVPSSSYAALSFEKEINDRRLFKPRTNQFNQEYLCFLANNNKPLFSRFSVNTVLYITTFISLENLQMSLQPLSISSLSENGMVKEINIYQSINELDISGFLSKKLNDLVKKFKKLSPPPILVPIPECKKEMNNELQKPECDIFIICALDEPELRAVKELWEGEWTDEKLKSQTFWKKTITVKSDKLTQKIFNIVCASRNKAGLSYSAVLTTSAIIDYQPKLVVMLGIAAGILWEANQNEGDIIFATRTYDYGAGKVTPDGFQPNMDGTSTIKTIVDSVINSNSVKLETLKNIKKSWSTKQEDADEGKRKDTPTNDLRFWQGELGSGAGVMDSSDDVKEIRRNYRKMIGLEMEAHAVHVACSETLALPIPFLCLKSVCDRADGTKDKKYQPYAAYTSAQIFKMLLEEKGAELWGGK